MSEPQYLIGIDLGTSNCAVAWAALARGAAAEVGDFPVPQLQRLGEVAPRPLLPSCLYLPGEHELPREALRLPWEEAPGLIIGEFARWQGGRVPGRLVASAKSWLCHPGVDRSAPILPWGAPSDVRKLSPVAASAGLLQHMARAWDHAHPEAPLAAQEVIITVPASFDEVARALTVAAAREAGFGKFTLLEEPQAAFYDFSGRRRQESAAALEGVRLVLVVDVGGGTSDFTLVQAGLGPDGPVFRRIAVGEHLMLGGDNMDAALGRRAEERMLSGGRKLSPAQWSQLVQACRAAKEALLQENSPEQYHLSIASEGSRLIGGALSTHLTRAEAVELILNGFFPACDPHEPPRRSSRTALQELGLPYAQDAAITRQLAAFLRAHASAGFAALGEADRAAAAGGLPPRPDAILLNGGVFNSGQIAGQLLRVMSGWWPDAPPIRLLAHDSLDLAVARGAAYYGLARHGLGHRISGGSAHGFYVGLEQKDREEPLALCVAPRGQEEGETIDMGGRVFQLALGRPVQFPLYTTTSDRVEKAGDIIPVTEDLKPLPPIHALLKSGNGKTGRAAVHLRSTLTEIGTLELWCVANESPEQWRLEFELRGDAAPETTTVVESMPPRFAEATTWIQTIFGKPGAAARPAAELKGTPPKDVKHLWASLEKTLGAREEWRVPVLRELWSALFAGAGKRRRSADHERVFAQLLGYSLRPGFGYPLDEWRCEETARLFAELVQYHKEKAVWTEFWVLWRRIAGGLTEVRHQEIWNYLKPHLIRRLSPTPPKNQPKPKGIQPEGFDEMVRLAAALEHLPPADKVELGQAIAARLHDPAITGGPWAWALGRLGARVPIYGSVHKAAPTEVAEQWLNLLLEPKCLRIEGALFALAQLARLTGDRAREIDNHLRERALATLVNAQAPASWQRMIREVVALEAADKARALGDTLPVGLQLA